MYFIFFLSGAAGLGYQMVWMRMFAIGLGHEMPSVLAVITAFFGGLAIGAWMLDRRVSESRTPARWYVVCEVLIGVWAIASVLLIPWVNEAAAKLIGVDVGPVRHWAWSFVLPFACLAPATVAMGATFPAMERTISRARQRGRMVAGVYAANTAGAIAGVAGTTFLVVPSLGYSRTLLLLAGINFLCALLMWIGPGRGEHRREPVHDALADAPPQWRLLITIFFTGLLGIGFEVLGIRVMAQVLENTVYSYASALVMYLVGTALGAAIYQRAAAYVSFTRTLDVLLKALCLSILLSMLTLQHSDTIYRSIASALGNTRGGAIIGEMTLAACVFLIPTMLMGALFSHLAQAARHSRGGVGRAMAVNTFGAALAGAVFGVVLLPHWGAKWALCTVALGYLFLLRRPRPDVSTVLVAACAGVLVVLLPATLMLVTPAPGGRVIDYREGVMAAVAVTESADGRNRQLKVNNRFQMGGLRTQFAERRQAHIPLLLHPDPRSALFLGVGTGITASTALFHPALSTTAVELVPEVLEMTGYFDAVNGITEEQKAQMYRVGDARRYVRAVDETYDVIVADLFHPARDGAGALYTLEHFQAGRSLLNDGGLFCQWLPTYQLDEATLKLIMRTFLEVFPQTHAYIGIFNVEQPAIALVGFRDEIKYDATWYGRRVQDVQLAAALREAGLQDELNLFGCLLAGTDELRSFSGTGSLNRDDLPLVVFQAPTFAYEGYGTSHGRLQTMIDAFDPDAASTLRIDGQHAVRINSFIAARNHYLRALIAQREGDLSTAIRESLASAAASPDFRFGYSMAFRFASELREAETDVAREILMRLREINPRNREVAEAIFRWFSQ